MKVLEGKKIILGITGGIPAYKSADLASKLVQAGAQVFVVMTKAAQEFITPLTFRALTGQPVRTEIFEPASPFPLQHISLAQMADVVVIAPATANTIAKLAAGLADEMLCLTVLSTKAPIILAPAMDSDMYENPATQENLSKLKARGFHIFGPAYGRLASGRIGWGRMEEPERIIGFIRWVLGKSGDLAGKKIVVTAGGTQEPIDPVRHISNPSSGKMGYAIAEAGRDRGAQVVLISAPTYLPDPVGVEVIKVRTTEQMKEAVERAVVGCDALIMAAAVSDYRPKKVAESKIKKIEETFILELERTPDILGEVRGDFIRVGFAAESENLIENASKKLMEKNLDFIVANDITQPDSGFGADTNRVVIIDKEGKIESLPLLPKLEVAYRVLDRVALYLKGKKVS